MNDTIKIVEKSLPTITLYNNKINILNNDTRQTNSLQECKTVCRTGNKFEKNKEYFNKTINIDEMKTTNYSPDISLCEKGQYKKSSTSKVKSEDLGDKINGIKAGASGKPSKTQNILSKMNDLCCKIKRENDKLFLQRSKSKIKLKLFDSFKRKKSNNLQENIRNDLPFVQYKSSNYYSRTSNPDLFKSRKVEEELTEQSMVFPDCTKTKPNYENFNFVKTESFSKSNMKNCLTNNNFIIWFYEHKNILKTYLKQNFSKQSQTENKTNDISSSTLVSDKTYVQTISDSPVKSNKTYTKHEQNINQISKQRSRMQSCKNKCTCNRDMSKEKPPKKTSSKNMPKTKTKTQNGTSDDNQQINASTNTEHIKLKDVKSKTQCDNNLSTKTRKNINISCKLYKKHFKGDYCNKKRPRSTNIKKNLLVNHETTLNINSCVCESTKKNFIMNSDLLTRNLKNVDNDKGLSILNPNLKKKQVDIKGIIKLNQSIHDIHEYKSNTENTIENNSRECSNSGEQTENSNEKHAIPFNNNKRFQEFPNNECNCSYTKTNDQLNQHKKTHKKYLEKIRKACICFNKTDDMFLTDQSSTVIKDTYDLKINLPHSKLTQTCDDKIVQTSVVIKEPSRISVFSQTKSQTKSIANTHTTLDKITSTSNLNIKTNLSTTTLQENATRTPLRYTSKISLVLSPPLNKNNDTNDNQIQMLHVPTDNNNDKEVTGKLSLLPIYKSTSRIEIKPLKSSVVELQKTSTTKIGGVSLDNSVEHEISASDAPRYVSHYTIQLKSEYDTVLCENKDAETNTEENLKICNCEFYSEHLENVENYRQYQEIKNDIINESRAILDIINKTISKADDSIIQECSPRTCIKLNLLKEITSKSESFTNTSKSKNVSSRSESDFDTQQVVSDKSIGTSSANLSDKLCYGQINDFSETEENTLLDDELDMIDLERQEQEILETYEKIQCSKLGMGKNDTLSNSQENIFESEESSELSQKSLPLEQNINMGTMDTCKYIKKLTAVPIIESSTKLKLTSESGITFSEQSCEPEYYITTEPSGYVTSSLSSSVVQSDSFINLTSSKSSIIEEKDSFESTSDEDSNYTICTPETCKSFNNTQETSSSTDDITSSISESFMETKVPIVSKQDLINNKKHKGTSPNEELLHDSIFETSEEKIKLTNSKDISDLMKPCKHQNISETLSEQIVEPMSSSTSEIDSNKELTVDRNEQNEHYINNNFYKNTFSNDFIEKINIHNPLETVVEEPSFIDVDKTESLQINTSQYANNHVDMSAQLDDDSMKCSKSIDFSRQETMDNFTQLLQKINSKICKCENNLQGIVEQDQSAYRDTPPDKEQSNVNINKTTKLDIKSHSLEKSFLNTTNEVYNSNQPETPSNDSSKPTSSRINVQSDSNETYPEAININQSKLLETEESIIIKPNTRSEEGGSSQTTKKCVTLQCPRGVCSDERICNETSGNNFDYGKRMFKKIQEYFVKAKDDKEDDLIDFDDQPNQKSPLKALNSYFNSKFEDTDSSSYYYPTAFCRQPNEWQNEPQKVCSTENCPNLTFENRSSKEDVLK